MAIFTCRSRIAIVWFDSSVQWIWIPVRFGFDDGDGCAATGCALWKNRCSLMAGEVTTKNRWTPWIFPPFEISGIEPAPALDVVQKKSGDKYSRPNHRLGQLRNWIRLSVFFAREQARKNFPSSSPPSSRHPERLREPHLCRSPRVAAVKTTSIKLAPEL